MELPSTYESKGGAIVWVVPLQYCTCLVHQETLRRFGLPTKVKLDKCITYLVEHGRVLLIKPPDRVAALTGGDVSIEGGQVEHGIPRREHRRRDRCR